MAEQVNRLSAESYIDRRQPLCFEFDGRTIHGFAGDTVASALLANGVNLVGRSFKYHRPRGFLAAGVEEPNGLVTLAHGDAREPNLPATTIEAAHGLNVESQNRWPSLRFDALSILSLFKPFLPVGFYYKTFMGPAKSSWMWYEPFIRRAAGLGRASLGPDPSRYDQEYHFTDVLVIGAGTAGLSAARTAAQSGKRVTVVEQDFRLGGANLSALYGGASTLWLKEVIDELSSLPNVTLLPHTTAFGAYDGMTFGLVRRRHAPDNPLTCRQDLIMARAARVIYATGAFERPLLFKGNDLPGVMLASAIRTYANRFSVLPGRRIIIAANNDSAYEVAGDLAGYGADVLLVDTRHPDERGAESTAFHGFSVLTQARVLSAYGKLGVRGAVIETPSGVQSHACDCIGVSGGWTPNIHLTCHKGRKPRFDSSIKAFVPDRLDVYESAVGACAGELRQYVCVADGEKAGEHATSLSNEDALAVEKDPVSIESEASFIQYKDCNGAHDDAAFVDLQMDVTVGDIALAQREGFENVEHLKRYAGLGFGTDQGKTSNLNGIDVMAGLRNAASREVGVTTFRPPFTPVTLGALAGRARSSAFRPTRRTPMHDWHIQNGAVMLDVGLWKRPHYYQTSGNTLDEACAQEMRTVRRAAGLMDISTLGKIDIQGPDAAEFLDRVYVNQFSKLKVGKARYGVMLRDDGFVLDDGTTTRLSETQFFMTTQTAMASEVLSRLELLLSTAWTDLRVAATSVSDEWAAMSVAGPKSRTILASVFPDTDVSNDALPHMGLAHAELDGRTIRILRLSYSGERAYEIYATASFGEAVWRRVIECGAPYGLIPYGTEALGGLRIEKGHVAGPEIDGRTTLPDLRLEKMDKKDKDFVGAPLASREALNAPNRGRLVGLKSPDKDKFIRPGGILFADGDEIAGHGRGRVTAATYSPELDANIALGLLDGEKIKEGDDAIVAFPVTGETPYRVQIVSPVFVDPDGERMRG